MRRFYLKVPPANAEIPHACLTTRHLKPRRGISGPMVPTCLVAGALEEPLGRKTGHMIEARRTMGLLSRVYAMTTGARSVAKAGAKFMEKKEQPAIVDHWILRALVS